MKYDKEWLFYNHPVIQQLADRPRWTISGQNKRPLDMQAFLHTGKVVGAKFHDGRCLMDLHLLRQNTHHTSNYCYFMDTLEDGFIILDIEPKCPAEVKEQLLQLPYLYGEISLSGNGYHLILPLPKNFHQFPKASRKMQLKEEHGWYELLMSHWCTFTKNMIPVSRGREDWEALYASLAAPVEKKAVESEKTAVAFDVQSRTLLEEPLVQQMVTELTAHVYKKSPADFHNDFSRYEFGLLSSMACRYDFLINTKKYRGFGSTPQKKIWCLYEAARIRLPQRDHEKGKRGGLPFLLYQSRRVVEVQEARRAAQDAFDPTQFYI